MGKKIQLEIVGDSRSVERAFKRAGGAADGFSARVKRSFSGLSRTAAFGVGAVAGAAISIGVLSVRAASDLGEQVNKTSVVFGKGAKMIQAWAKTTAASLGISNVKALEFAGTFGNMLVPMGIADTKAAKMSKSLVGLAGDMASFNNANVEDVLIAIQAGLAGETEPLRRFGVFLNQDRIEAEALASGLAQTTKDMTKIKLATLGVSKAQLAHTEAVRKHGPKSREAQNAMLRLEYEQGKLTKALAGSKPKLTALQKAMATYNIIMRDTKLAHGDFANTLNTSLPNSIRVMKAMLADLAAAFGLGLIPVVRDVALRLRRALGGKDVNDMVRRLGFLVGTKLRDAFFVLKDAFIALKKWFDTNWPGIHAALKKTADVIIKVVDAFKWLDKHKGPSGIDLGKKASGLFGNIGQKIQSGLRGGGGGGGGGGKGGDVILQVDKRELGRVTSAQQNRGAQSTAGQSRGRRGGIRTAIG